jgi:hypothetical protein
MTDTQRNDTMPPDIEAYHMGIHAKKDAGDTHQRSHAYALRFFANIETECMEFVFCLVATLGAKTTSPRDGSTTQCRLATFAVYMSA